MSGKKRHVIVKVDDDIQPHDDGNTYIRVTHRGRDGRLRHNYVPVPSDDQLTRAIDLARDALIEAAGDRRAEDEQFDISRADAAENERVADAYMEAFAYLRAAFDLDEGRDDGDT